MGSRRMITIAEETALVSYAFEGEVLTEIWLLGADGWAVTASHKQRIPARLLVDDDSTPRGRPIDRPSPRRRIVPMASQADRQPVRLAELVAALSLGIDLGFGQPMEHVLRQCLIALRLAERVGLDEDERAVVYYTALLVNVGCHTDAHEQAKWFGDDIALKAIKYEHGPGRRDGRGQLRMIGAGNPPLHRFRVGLEFALSGRREVDGMIDHHAALAVLAGRAARAVRRRAGGGRVRVRAVGRPRLARRAEPATTSRWPRASPASPTTSRWPTAWAASTPRGSWRAAGSGRQFDPALCRGDLRRGRDDPCGARRRRHLGRGDRRRAGARGGARAPSRSTRRCAAVANFVDLKSPYSLGHAGAVADLAGDAGRRLGLSERRGRRAAAGRARARPRPARASPTRSGTSPGRSAPASGSGCACTPT